MVRFKYRKVLSFIMALFMIITTLESLIPRSAYAADNENGIGVSASSIEDPITPDMVSNGVSTIDQVYTLSTNTITTVIGQVSYIYGSIGTADTALLQDVINNEIIGIQIYDKNNISKYHIGDIVEVTGKIGIYGGVRQLSSVSNIKEDGAKVAFPAQELTIEQLLAGGDSYISELVRIKNVTVGAYNSISSNNTPVQDSTGSINIFKAAAYPTGLAQGDTADIVAAFSKYNATFQLRNGSSADYSKIVPPAVAVETPKILPDADNVPLGQELTMTTATSGAAIYYSVNDGTATLYEEANKPVVNSFPYMITAYASKTGLTDSEVASISYSQSKVAAVDTSEKGAVKLGTKVQLVTATSGAAIQYSMDNGTTWKDYDDTTGIVLNTLPVDMLAKSTKAGFIDSDVSSFSYTKKLNGVYSLYFGQLHSHTNYSDGQGTCEEAFNYAKNTAQNIDFLAVTDHSNSFDNASNATILDGSMSTEWIQGHKLADQFTDNTFVGIYGYEMTWSNGLGHMNTFNTDGFQTRDQSNFSTYNTALANYYTALKLDPDSISQFNHPGATFGDFNNFANYDEAADKAINLIEVGNGEGAIHSSGYFASYEYYTRALDKGWHVAPTNNQDNHKGLWGDANTARTVVLADSLTREDIYDALREMRVYATEDSDLQIQYTLNNSVMGTVMTNTPDKVSIKVNLKDLTDTAIGKVDVIVNGGLVAATKTVTDNEETVTFDLPADYSYYYIRVTESDNDIAVTAPIWIKDVEAAGISDITTTEKLPVKGESLKVTTEVFNNETAAMTVQSMEFRVNDTVIHTADINSAGLSTLASGETKAYSFDYIYNSVGDVDIKVTVHATLNGVEKVFQDVLKLKYTDPSMVTNIVVDGTHYNDYVSGYYGGNMANLTEIAAGMGMRVKVVKDTITEDTLANCDLLIISAPAKKSGSTSAGSYVVSHFEDNFISLVKNYVAKGGDLIVCGLADYQDTTNGQSSTEINKLLAAINATTRINSDEAIDKDSNGGQEYRLYLDDYNIGSAYLGGVASDQVYSAYSGCTVLLDSNTVTAGKAEYLVNGHSTTYSIDSKSYGGSYTEIEKGNAVLLAREELNSGSNVFIGGTVFMSNFEVKATLDNIWDKQYSNRTIMENILNSVKKELPVNSVSSVRSGVKGNVYCVEGTVTSGTASPNAFFDTIYLQDATGGINIFPINQGLIEVGQKVKVIGTLDEYLGDLELRVISASVVDTNKTILEPTKVTTKEAMNYPVNGGKLVNITGTVTNVIKKNDVIETIMVKDASGVEARVFIDGYIGYSDLTTPKIESFIAAGKTISAIGLVSYDTEGVRLRVRNRNEITNVSPTVPTITPVSPTPGPVIPSAAPNPPTSISPIPTAIPTAIPIPSTTPDSNKIINNVTVKQNDSSIKTTLDGTMSNGIIKLQLSVNADKFLDKANKKGTMNKPLPFEVRLGNEELAKLLAKFKVDKIKVTVTIPDEVFRNDKVEVSAIIMDSSLVKAASNVENTCFAVEDGEGNDKYSYCMKGEDLKNSKVGYKDFNLAMTVETITDKNSLPKNNVDMKGLLLHFNGEGVLPAPAKVKINVSDQIGKDAISGLNSKSDLEVFYYNPITRKFEGLGKCTKANIGMSGDLNFTVTHFSDYVVLTKAPDKSILTPLVDQVKITVNKKTLSKKGKNKTAKIKVKLPSTLELVNKINDKTSSDAIGAATVTYKSADNKIATVNSKGQITAVSSGSTTINVTIKLYDGKKKTYKLKITVK